MGSILYEGFRSNGADDCFVATATLIQVQSLANTNDCQHSSFCQEGAESNQNPNHTYCSIISESRPSRRQLLGSSGSAFRRFVRMTASSIRFGHYLVNFDDSVSLSTLVERILLFLASTFDTSDRRIIGFSFLSYNFSFADCTIASDFLVVLTLDFDPTNIEY